MFFNFWSWIMLTVENKNFWDVVFRKPTPLMCMRSHHRVKLLYLSRITLGKFGTMIGFTCWVLWQIFCLENVAHWVHRCPRPSRNIISELEYYSGCCYQPHVVFNLMVVCWCARIDLHNQPYLHHRRCTVSSFPPIVGWGAWIIHHGMPVICFDKVTHIVVEETNLVHLDC